MGTCYIIGAGEFTARDLCPGDGDFIIAADGGYHSLRQAKIMPHLLLGDFDSLDKADSLPSDLSVLRFPVHKDDTDTGIALAHGWSLGFRDFAIYGGGGGRIDHLLANLQSMCRYSKLGGSLRLIGRDCDIFTLTNGTLALPPRPAGTLVSVFCHGERATGVTLGGLLYPLTNATLTCDEPLGVSNQMASKNGPATVSVTAGTVFIMVYLNASPR